MTTIAGNDAPWIKLHNAEFRSRMLVGIEQYTNPQEIAEVLRAAGADVFITTCDPDRGTSSVLLTDLADHLNLWDYIWIGTTSFARSEQAALRTAAQLQDSWGISVLKLDVRDESNVPDVAATISAAEKLLAEGWEVLPLIPPDVRTAISLQDAGVSALRLMANRVGSGHGIVDVRPFRAVVEAVEVPVVVESGIGSAKHVVQAMELGVDAVLVNAAILHAQNRTAMAAALKAACDAGRASFLAGLMPGDDGRPPSGTR